MSASKPIRKRSWKRRWFTRLALTTLIVSAVSGVSFWVWYAQCEAELDAEIARVRAAGEPVEFADLAPRRHDALREAQVTTALKAVPRSPRAFFDTLEGEMQNPRFLRGELLPPGDYPELRKAVAASRAAMAKLAVVVRQGDCRFSYDYSEKIPIAIVLPQFDHLHRIPPLMKADVIQSLGTGDPRRAVQAIDDMLHITEVVRHDPFIVSHLVRRRDHDQALGLLELVLKHAALDAKQRRELDTTLGGIETTLRFRQAMLAERAMVVTIIGTAGTDEFAQMLRWMATNRPTGAVQDWIWQVRDSAQSRWWGSFAHRPRLFQEKTYALRTLGRLADLVDVPGPAATRRWDNTWAGIKRDLKDYPINALVLPWLGGVRGPGLQLRQRLIAARLALRVDRFRREHGKLPETLDAVLDERIKAIPLGLISGRPLSYKPTPEGFRIFDTDPKDGKAVGEFKVSYGK